MKTAKIGFIVAVSVAVLAVVALPLGVGAVVLMTMLGASNQSCATGDVHHDAASSADWQAPDTGGVTAAGLDSKQVQVAKQGWLTAQQLGFGDQGATVFIATSMQESKLGAHPGISKPNEDGDVGPMQQRAKVGWYGGQSTMAANVDWLNNPANAAQVFFQGRKLTRREIRWAAKAGTDPAGPAGYRIPGLAQVKGWRDLPVTVAAQRVQRSAYPDAYHRYKELATSLVTQFRSEAGTADTSNQASNVDAGGGNDDSIADTDCVSELDAATAMNCPASGLAAEKRMTPDGLLLMRCIHQSFPQVSALLGVGDRSATVDNDHQAGRAVDAMLSSHPVGEQLAAWAKKNASKLGIKYIIWDAHIWSVQRSKEGWRACGSAAASCYNGPNDTQAHRDHVHLSVYGDSAQKAETGGATAIKGSVTTPIAKRSYRVGARWGATGSWSRYHTGQDLAASIGTGVRAVAAGKVETARGGSWAGTHIVIRHSDGSATLYAHLSITTVNPGDTVTPGQRIGLVGMTGRTFGPHLHLEHYPPGKGRIGNPYTTDDPATWLASKGAGL